MTVFFNPFIRDICRHTDRETTVFRKQDIFLCRTSFQQGFLFCLGSNHLHRIKRVEVIDGLILLNSSCRQLWSLLTRQLIGLEPFSRSRFLEWRIFYRRIITTSAHYILQIIDIIFTWYSLRLESNLSFFPVYSKPSHIHHPFACLRIDYNQILRFGIQIAPTPVHGS